WLIGDRALMGLGAAAIFPTTLSIITNMFDGRERGRAIAVWAAMAGVGVALGPILGGLLLDRWWWGSVLLVNLPIAATCLLPLGAGFRLAPPALGLLIGAPLSARLAERVGAKIVVASGLSCAAVSLLLQSRVTVLTHDVWLAPVFALFGVGMGMTMAPATDSI